MTERSRAALLVLRCARVRPHAGDARAIAELASGPIDWDEALALTLRDGLAPLMHRHLAALAPGTVPKRVAAALWARAESVSRRNLAMARELCEVLDVLEAEGVAAVPFKGPVLTADLYGDPGLREFGDLDLLVAPHDLLRAKSLLAARGYLAQHALPADLEARWLRSWRYYEMPMVDERRGFMVELQWNADAHLAIPPVGDPAWWNALERRDFMGRPVRRIPERENTLALLVHGSKHSWGNLGWLVDIAEIARRDGTDWGGIVAIARERNARRRVALGLHLAHELLQAPLPADVLAFVDEAGIRERSEKIAASVLSREAAPAAPMRTFHAQLAMLDTPAQRVCYALRSAFEPSLGDWERWRLPRALSFLYWVLRPARMARKYLFSRSPRTPPAATPRTPPPRPRSTG